MRRLISETQSFRDFLGIGIVCIVSFLAVFGPMLAPYSPVDSVGSGQQLLPPSWMHWMGTDANGLDVFSRVIAAARVDLSIAVAATAVAAVTGVLLSLFAALGSRLMDNVVSRLADVVQSFPVFLLGMIFVVAVGQRVSNLVIVVGLLNAPLYLRLTRTQVLFLREQPFVEAARAGGNTMLSIAVRQILPNALSPAISTLSITVGMAILLTSGLSFVGAGVRVPTPEWGIMIAMGAPNIYTGEWWTSIFPGIALAVTVLGFALIGDLVGRLWVPKSASAGGPPSVVDLRESI